jgi:DNA-directed RNA polymerase specialized sigma24 family protein
MSRRPEQNRFLDLVHEHQGIVRRVCSLYATTPDERDDDDVRALHAAIRTIPTLDRAIVLLYLEQHSHDEIAAITGLEPKNVGVRIVRIKKRLRARIGAPRAGENAV